MEKVILVAESGADISKETAEQYGIHIVPMYILFGEICKADGTFPTEEIIEFYRRIGAPPKTSCATPYDFSNAFDQIHEQYPDGKILYLAYSGITTSTFQNGKLAAENRSYVTCLDTKQASAGQGMIVTRMAQMIQDHPDWDIKRAANEAKSLIERSHMCFITSNLDFLRAGGRCSNVTALCGNMLGIHPLIDMVDGRPKATKKYRGRMRKIIPKMIADYAEAHRLEREELCLMHSPELSEECKWIAEQAAKQCGFKKIYWNATGGVITCHGGPGAFGIAGFTQ